jgi:hypothetical protein
MTSTSTPLPNVPKGGVDLGGDGEHQRRGQRSLIGMEQPCEREEAVGVDRADNAGGLEEQSDDVARQLDVIPAEHRTRPSAPWSAPEIDQANPSPSPTSSGREKRRLNGQWPMNQME